MINETLSPDLFARLACEQDTVTFVAAYDSHGIDLIDPRWARWLVPTAGPTATVLAIEVARQLSTVNEWAISPKLLAGLLGVGRPRLATAIARAIRFRLFFPCQNGSLALDIRPIPPAHAVAWPEPDITR